jgi:hypothetical protein
VNEANLLILLAVPMCDYAHRKERNVRKTPINAEQPYRAYFSTKSRKDGAQAAPFNYNPFAGTEAHH